MLINGHEIADAKLDIVRDRMKAGPFTAGALSSVALAFLVHLPAYKSTVVAQRIADRLMIQERGRCNIRIVDDGPTWTWIGPRP